jgi:fatty-acyl-CoA synthase
VNTLSERSELHMATVAELLARSAKRYPDKLALVLPDERATYAELAERTVHIARLLLALNVERGSHVGIMMLNSVDNVASLFACGLAGSVAVPVNNRFPEQEVRHLLQDSGVSLILTSQLAADRVDRAAAALAATGPGVPGRKPEIIVADLARDTDLPVIGKAAATAAARRVTDRELYDRACSVRSGDAGLIIYTSGTTSFPKGVVLSHEAFMLWGVTMALRFSLTGADRLWDAKPFFHAGGLQGVVSTLAVGGTYLTMPFFDAEVGLRQIRDWQCTVAWPVYETIWMRMLNHPEFAASGMSSLRAIGMVGTPDQLRSVQRRLPHAAVTSSYGSTECNPAAYSTPSDPEEIRLNTVGRPAPGVELRVVDVDSDQDAAPGTVGELVYRGPTRFLRYHRDAELTAAKVDAGGWYRSGDLGSMDPDGLVRYGGRIKDMLKVGGENVAAAEIESVLVRHPAVSVAAVIGVADSDYGEVPAAFVELKPGSAAGEGELIAWCASQLARFRVPRYVRFITEWPMSATKIKKNELRELLAAELRGSGTAG